MQKVRRHSVLFVSRIPTAYRVTNSRSFSPYFDTTCFKLHNFLPPLPLSLTKVNQVESRGDSNTSYLPFIVNRMCIFKYL